MKIKLNSNFYPDNQALVISSFDPGKTLGVATALLGREGAQVWEARFHTCTYRFPEDAKALADVELSVSDILIVETWRLFGSHAKQLIGDALPGPQCLGYIVGKLWETGQEKKLVYQTPSNKEHVDIESVRNWLGESWGTSEHERDAIRHLIFYLQKGKAL